MEGQNYFQGMIPVHLKGANQIRLERLWSGQVSPLTTMAILLTSSNVKSHLKPHWFPNSSNCFQFDQYVAKASYMPQHLGNYWNIHAFFCFSTLSGSFWVLGSIGDEKLAKLWSSNSETICFPHLLLTANFTTLTCVLVHSISGKGPSWRPLPVGFSSSWPFWKYIETSTQDTFQTQIFHCLCIRCLVVWVCFPGCFFGGSELICSFKAVIWC